MAAETSNYTPSATNTISVVDPQFCAPYPVDLTFKRKHKIMGIGDFSFTDVNGNIVFKVERAHFSLHSRHTLLDANGNPLLNMQRMVFTARDRWKVFRGDSSDSNDLLFSVKRSSLFQIKTKLDVFLAANVNEEACDFKIKAKRKSCMIFIGDSDNLIAQMHKKHRVQNVTVYQNVDYAFVAALILILHEITEETGMHHNAHHAGGASAGGASAGGTMMM